MDISKLFKIMETGGFARFRNFKISKLIGFHMARSLKKGPNWQGATLSVRLEGWINAKLQHLPGMNNEGCWHPGLHTKDTSTLHQLASGSQLCAMLKRVDCFWPYATRTKETKQGV